MAVELGSAYLSVGASTDGFSKDVKRAFGDVDTRASKTGKSAGSRLAKGLGTGLKVATGAAAGLAAVVSGMALKGGISRALDTEDAFIQMKRMGLSVKEVDSLVAGVDKTFDGTIFTNPDGFALAGLLHGAKVDLEAIPGVIGTIADFAAHGNVPLQQMSDVFLKVIGNGRVTGETFNQLVAAGVPLAQISDSLGVTEEQMRKMASAGELSSEMFLEAAAGAEMFQGAAKAAGEGSRGAFSNVLSQVSKLGEIIVSPIFGEGGPMVTLFKAMRETLISLRPAFQKAGDALAQNLVPWIERMAEAVPKIPGRLTAIAAGIGGIWAVLRGGDFQGADATFGLEEDSPIVGILTTIHEKFSALFEIGQQVWSTLAPAFAELGPALLDFLSAFSPLALMFQVLEPVLPKIAEAMATLGATVAGALTEAMPHLSVAVSALATGLVDVVDALLPLLPALAELLPALLPLIPPFAELISTLLPPLVELLVAVVEPIVGLLVPALGLLADYLTNIGVPALEKWWGVLGAVVGGIAGAITTYIGWLTRFWEGTVEKFNFVRDHIGEFPDAVKALFAKAGEWLYQAGRDLLDGLWRGASSIAESVKERIGNIGSGITDRLKSVFGISSPSKVFASIGRDLMRGMGKGITDNRDTVSKALDAMAAIVVKGADEMVKREADRLIKARERENKRLTKAGKKSLGTLSRADAEKQARKNLKVELDAQKAAQRILDAQSKRTGAGRRDLLAGLTRGGNVRKGAAGREITGFTLADIARARESVAKSLAAARDTLADLRAERAQMRDQVASSIRSELDLTAGIGQATTDALGRQSAGKTTFQSVSGVVKTMAAKAKTFATLLGRLRTAGIPAGLIQEIAGYGTEQGSEVAKALLSGSATQIKALAADFTSLETWSKKAGEYVAGATFDTAIAAQQGIIAGLEADDAKLEKAAAKLAKKLTKAIKKALKIKSPSGLWRDEVGHMLTDGVIEGLDDGQPALNARVAGMVPTPNVAAPRGMAGNRAEVERDARLAKMIAAELASNPMVARAYLDDREARKVTQKGIQEIRRTDPGVLR